MKSFLLLCTVLLTLSAGLRAAESGPPAPADAKWLAAAQAAYPLKQCLVSGEALGGMGEPYDFVYRAEGQPDRLIRLCCKNCVKRFLKEPAKYLAKLDAAAAPARQP